MSRRERDRVKAVNDFAAAVLPCGDVEGAWLFFCFTPGDVDRFRAMFAEYTLLGNTVKLRTVQIPPWVLWNGRRATIFVAARSEWRASALAFGLQKHMGRSDVTPAGVAASGMFFLGGMTDEDEALIERVGLFRERVA